MLGMSAPASNLIPEAETTPCHFCGKQIAFALDKKYGHTVMLELAPNRSGQFLISGGYAVWWGSTGVKWRKHYCPNTIRGRRERA